MPPSRLEEKFWFYWSKVLQGPSLVREFKFHPTRLWRFDFAQPDLKIAIEIEGGVHGGRGRHTRGEGFIADCEKYNEATMSGWSVVRITSKQINSRYISILIGWVETRQQEIGRLL